MGSKQKNGSRFGMVIDLDRCTGCGSCMVACAVENNIPPGPLDANERTGNTWIRVQKVDSGLPFPQAQTAFVPVTCQQCGDHAPCVAVCPQNAVEVDPETGVVGQIPERCLGCRYCMTACPYHARSFNWWDPTWPAGMEQTLNPDVSPRMRGVAEKCNFCHGRYHAAKAKAALEGRRELRGEEYVPACVEACPAGAIRFGDLSDETTAVGQAIRDGSAFRLLESVRTDPKIYYRTERPWLRQLAGKRLGKQEKESVRG